MGAWLAACWTGAVGTGLLKIWFILSYSLVGAGAELFGWKGLAADIAPGVKVPALMFIDSGLSPAGAPLAAAGAGAEAPPGLNGFAPTFGVHPLDCTFILLVKEKVEKSKIIDYVEKRDFK